MTLQSTSKHREMKGRRFASNRVEWNCNLVEGEFDERTSFLTSLDESGSLWYSN